MPPLGRTGKTSAEVGRAIGDKFEAALKIPAFERAFNKMATDFDQFARPFQNFRDAIDKATRGFEDQTRRLQELRIQSTSAVLSRQVAMGRALATAQKGYSRAYQIESGRQQGAEIGGAAGSLFGPKGVEQGKKLGGAFGEVAARSDWLIRGFRDLTSEALFAAKGLIGIGTVVGTVHQAASGTGGLSTLQKSWELVLGELGLHLLPAILAVSGGLQHLAEDLKNAKSIPDAISRLLKPHGKPENDNALQNILRKSAEGWERIDWHFGGGRERERGSLDNLRAANLSSSRRIFEAQGPAERALMERLGQRRVREGTLESGKVLDLYGRVAGDKGLQAELRRARKADVAAGWDRRLHRNIQGRGQGGIFPEGMGPAAGGDLFANLSRQWAQAGREAQRQTLGGLTGLAYAYGAPVGKAPGGGKPGMAHDGLLHDMLPPGYNAQYQSFANVRREMQLKALNTSPLDQKLREQAMRFYEEAMRYMASKGQNIPEPPPR